MKLLSLAAAILAALICGNVSAQPQAYNIIPEPASLVPAKGSFKAAGAAVNCDPSIDAATLDLIRKFATRLSLVSGRNSSMATPVGIEQTLANSSVKGFLFLNDPSLADEEYSIDVTPKNVTVKASSYNGFSYAIATLKQLLPAEIYIAKAGTAKMTIPCCSIKDRPRFGYRGVELDCARHFFGVGQVKRFLDVIAMYKVNRFHWHLTDDQGWRVEIKKYPLLTEIGAFRSGTQSTYDRRQNDGIRYGGYYTQDQIKEVVEYAGKLGITVIPELDLPGHMLGAMAAYPWLGCTGGPYEVWTKWGVSDQVLCVGKETTFGFLFDVLDEMCELFPGEYFHIGGDECPKKAWEQCPVCQAKIAELGLTDGDGATKEQRLQNYVTKRVQDYLSLKGKKIIGWDEVLEGELAEGATVMSWRGTKGGIKASGMGFDVIMSPTDYCYLDYKQGEDDRQNTIGAGYARTKFYDAKNLYGFEPLEGLDEKSASHILGVQGNMWTEFIRNNHEVDYMLIPRLFALSEVQWSPKESRNYDRFVEKARAHFKIMDILGYDYKPL
ncbi:MAG: beta-N-acetylhexosaminidase [Bacteroidales bacterium]|nr:beta-N-acetylhexosaminidase [Bacteroidales bacterium]